VNRLSQATDAVRDGDFSARIPVRRSDQVGELQSSFNQMAENLEELVASEAQKESLEKELAIARELQQSLLPSKLPQADTLEFATLFEPSAAIGGDYFDILRIDESRLAVVIADVSGHGLPTGLRMAMIKAALSILVEERKQPKEILSRLSSMIRTDHDGRFFVTATVAVIDFRRGRVDLTNAGHPPTYLIRNGEVEEILLPGNPLGALGEDYGHTSFGLEPGDVLVWLSDGLIEMVNAEGEPFGYDAIRDALRAGNSSASAARDRVVRAVENHAAGIPADDDQTLVAMRYRTASSPSVP
jgi:sigma-B regulation protein RsbU (phosphoserine phosphatase)